MFWPDRGSGVDVEPPRQPVASAARQFFTEGGVGNPPTVPGGDWFNQITNELLNLLTAAGIEPSKVVDTQILEAIKIISKPADEARLSDLKSRYGIAAWAHAANFKKLIIDIDDVKSGTYRIPTGQSIEFLGVDVGQSDDLIAFEADSSFWEMTGNGRFYRLAGIPSTFMAGSVGLKIKSTAFRWNISGKLRAEHFADAGLCVDGLSVVTGNVSRSAINGLTCHENAFNYKFLAGFSSEYISLTNAYATDAIVCGVYEESGNINWVGGGITGNKGGVHLKHPSSGANPHHGMFVGVHINHNVDYQLLADEVALGYGFFACNFYDNGDSDTGRIILRRCRGINIADGTIGCSIEYISEGDFTGHVGYNSIHGNKCEEAAAVVTGPGLDRSKLIIFDNFDASGSWIYNDSAKVDYVSLASIDLPLPSLNSMAIHKFDTVLVDNRGAVTGPTFRPPWPATHDWQISLDISSITKVSGMWVDVLRDDAASGNFAVLASIPVVAISETRALCNGAFSFRASKGGQLGFILRSTGSLTDHGVAIKAGSSLRICSDE